MPDELAGVSEIDMSVTVLGRKLAMPLFLSPTALQRLFHHEGERAVVCMAEESASWLKFPTKALPDDLGFAAELLTGRIRAVAATEAFHAFAAELLAE